MLALTIDDARVDGSSLSLTVKTVSLSPYTPLYDSRCARSIGCRRRSLASRWAWTIVSWTFSVSTARRIS